MATGGILTYVFAQDAKELKTSLKTSEESLVLAEETNTKTNEELDKLKEEFNETKEGKEKAEADAKKASGEASEAQKEADSAKKQASSSNAEASRQRSIANQNASDFNDCKYYYGLAVSVADKFSLQSEAYKTAATYITKAMQADLDGYYSVGAYNLKQALYYAEVAEGYDSQINHLLNQF